jgi:hypothetical protein
MQSLFVTFVVSSWALAGSFFFITPVFHSGNFPFGVCEAIRTVVIVFSEPRYLSHLAFAGE